VITAVPLLLVSFGVILFAAELFTNGIEWVGVRLGLGHGAVGSILAAIGTAMPETMIPLIAILFVGSSDADDVGIGAILGAPFLLSTAAFAVAGLGLTLFAKQRHAGAVMRFDAAAITREGYHHGHLSAALLQAARVVLARDGLDGLTLRAVAREAGVSHNAPYHHFPDKAALLEALAADGWDRLGNALREAREAAGRRSLDRLQATGLAYVRFALVDPPRFRLMTRPGDKTGLVGAAATRAYEVLLDTVGQGQRDRSLRSRPSSARPERQPARTRRRTAFLPACSSTPAPISPADNASSTVAILRSPSRTPPCSTCTR
jgi:AcrR family transcriptional regulator